MELKAEESKLKTCIAILPEELWEMLLDTMENSRDIQSVLVAFPELSSLLHGKKATWYFDQIFPHIYKQFLGFGYGYDYRNIFFLRGVSKGWCNIVDSFLKNHPSRHPYNHNGINRRNVPYGQFNYIDENHSLSRWERIETLQKCYSEMMDHRRNPFVLGNLTISNKHFEKSHENFLDASLVFLQKFGHYVSSFDFTIVPNSDQEFEDFDIERLLEKIFECLSCAGNVQYLRINLILEANTLLGLPARMRTPEYVNRIPQLPHLTTLIVEDDRDNDTCVLSDIFSHANWIYNIKRLEVPLYSLMFSNNETFPNLCQLTLDMSLDDFELDFSKLTFLKKENFPVLRKLTFHTLADIDVSIYGLFRLLAGLEIEEMQLLGECTIANDQISPVVPISSVKYFRARDNLDQSFEFLKMFTSLEQLHLNISDWTDGTVVIKTRGRGWRKDRGFSSLLRMYMYKPLVPQDVNIWESLPTLKMLTVENNYTLRQYARECGNKPFRIRCDESDDKDDDDKSESESDESRDCDSAAGQ